MDSEPEPPRREYWPEEQSHGPPPHPADMDRYSATPDNSMSRRSARGPELSHGSESPHPATAGSARAPVPEPAAKAARRRGTQAPREPVAKEKKERKAPAKRGARESSAVPQDREMSAPISRIPQGSQSQQNATFKVTLNESNSLPPPPVPGVASAHARTGSGSNASARSRTTPSPTMGPPHRAVDEDYDEGVADALIGLSSYQGPGGKTQSQSLARSRTASVHSIASPGPHGPPSMSSRHDPFPPPQSTNRSPPVSTVQRPSPPYRPSSSLPNHPPSPQSMRNGAPSNRSPPSPFPRRGSSQPRDKTPSLKRGMEDESAGPMESKRSRVDVLNPMPSVFPPPPSTEARSSPNIGRGRFDPVLSSAADIRMSGVGSESPKGEPALPPIATLPPPPDSPRTGGKAGGDVSGDDGRSTSDRSGGGSRTASPLVHGNENGA